MSKIYRLREKYKEKISSSYRQLQLMYDVTFERTTLQVALRLKAWLTKPNRKENLYLEIHEQFEEKKREKRKRKKESFDFRLKKIF